MKKYSKVLSLALAFVMLFALCACGAAETPAAEPTAAPAADAPASEAPAETEAPAESQGVLDQIKADGVLYVTLSPDFAPMEFVDSSKDGQEQYVGLDVFLAKYIADYIGVKLVIEPMSFELSAQALKAAFAMEQSLLNFLQNEGFTHQKIANFTLQELALKSYKNED